MTTTLNARQRSTFPRAAAVALAAVVLGAAYLRVETLDRDSLWHDEAHSALIARLPPPDLVRASALADTNPPLYYVVLHYWTGLAGGSTETTLRMLSVLFGIGGVLAVLLAARRLGGTAVALWSAALLAAAVFHVQYSREARMYSLLFLLATASTYAFLRLTNGGRWRQAAWILTTIAMLLSHTVAIFTLAAQHVCWVFLRLYSRRSSRALAPPLLQWLGMNGLVALAIAPWVAAVVHQYERVAEVFWVPPPYLSAPLDVLIALAGSRIAFVALAVAGGAGALWLVRSPDPARTPPWPPRAALGVLAIWGAVPVLGPWLWSYIGVPIFIPRIAIVALAPLVIVAGFGIRAVRPRWASTAAGALLVALLAAEAWSYTHRLTKEDWRGVAAQIETEAGSGDLLLFHEASRRKGLDYYLRRPVADVAGFPSRRFGAGERINPAELERLNHIVRPYRRVWLILAHSRDQDRLIEKTLSRSFDRVGSREYRRIAVHLFVRRE